jgi:hypothetical protein
MTTHSRSGAGLVGSIVVMRRVSTAALILVSSACVDRTSTNPSQTARVLEAGWSFGFCLGPCLGALAIQGEELTYRISNREGDPLSETRGRLTASGAAKLASRASALPERLQASYGCPDCADAGAAYLVVSRDAASRRSEYEYPSPPAELASLDAFLKEVMAALARCAATSDVTLEGACSPAPR